MNLNITLFISIIILTIYCFIDIYKCMENFENDEMSSFQKNFYEYCKSQNKNICGNSCCTTY